MVKQIQKVSQTYGYVSFSKSGKVTPVISTLEGTNDEQEIIVINQFVDLLNNRGRKFKEPQKLSQSDHDFIVYEGDQKITIQLTELKAFKYSRPVKDTSDYGEPIGNFVEIDGKNPLVLDDDKQNSALAESISKKIEKRYFKSESDGKLLLVIFSTAAFFTIYWYQGKRVKSEAVLVAEELLRQVKDKNIFDEIWFFDLVTNPVLIWPSEELS